MQETYNLNAPVTAANFVQLPELSPKLTEATDKAHEIVYRYIMGEITMDEYDKEVNDFINKYKEIKDAYNAEIKKYVN
ncbi:MAG TPA: hypothetical protein GX527_11250 [Clostridiaceae bacterium]|nr:hypothetical protein [Clostridiaceae bacterium]